MLLCSAQVSAQVQIGLGGGVSMANIHYTGIDIESGYRTGFMFSIPISYQITPKFTAALIPSYVQKGTHSNKNDPPNSYQYKINYLQSIPEIRYNIFDGFHTGLGMYFSRRIVEFQKSGTNDWTATFRRDQGLSRLYDFGLTPSIHYHIGKISISARYLHGLSRTLDIEFVDPTTGQVIPNVRTFNRSFEVGVGYMFGW